MSSAILIARQAVTATSSDPSIQDALLRINTYGPYGYQPSLTGSIVFCAVWAVSAIILTYQGISTRRWWLLATLAFGSVLECAGNAIRIYGHFNSTIVDSYIAQQVILVLTPAFFAAAHFTILTKICLLFNESFIAPFKPTWLIPFFVVLDVVSLAIQGGGSGTAAVAEITGKSVDTINGNGQIVTAGLCIQLAGYVAFNLVFLLFVIRASTSTQKHQAMLWNADTKLFLLATWVSALLVLGRSVFRTVEMAKGWIGEVATTEWYYLTFDATLVALAVIILIIFSPTTYLPRPQDVINTISSPTISNPDSDIEGQEFAMRRTSSLYSGGAMEIEKSGL